ncbi:MAG TPA: sigma 54-interacting transcriptional regulator [Selenomonadales bacterium]|nr:sigma 54-interacting transcriptional regulator [Selenomonadales bacterium]
MKSIGIVTSRNSPLGGFLKGNLEVVFDGLVQIHNYYLDELRSAIYGDVVLIMVADRAMDVKPYLRKNQHMLLIQRTIKESEALRLAAIPANTRVLVVNDCMETVYETIALFCQVGINHLDMVPYVEGRDYHDIKIAVTPGESARVPPYIPTVIDVGNRCIDLSTFIRIINKLGIDDREVSKRLMQYAETIVTLDGGIKQQYKELFTKNLQLDTAINLSKEGILIVDNGGRVAMCNTSFRRMFPTGEEAVGRAAAELFPPGVLRQMETADAREGIIHEAGRTIMFTKHKIAYFGEAAGCLFVMQEATYIRQLERSLSRKLREQGLVARYHFTDIRTASPRMAECCRLAKRIAGSDRTVMLTGESGTGKEMVAQSIHNASPRGSQPFVAVNCAAVPESLLESELFGYEGGAFTGALKEGKAGLFEQAQGGTIFLDEIGDMPLLIQAKLLRVLQEKQVMRIGSQRVIGVNTRVIAATNRNLADKISCGQFREDLYYRLNVLPLHIPPLRERQEDILSLLKHFLAREGREGLAVADAVAELLLAYLWPGNVRELQNLAAYIAFMAEEGEAVTLDTLPEYLLASTAGYEREQVCLEEQCSLPTVLAIMRLLDERCQAGRSVGRYYLQERLGEGGCAAGEAEVRKILALLNKLGLTESKVGRGSVLTEKGKSMLGWMNNRIKNAPN